MTRALDVLTRERLAQEAFVKALHHKDQTEEPHQVHSRPLCGRPCDLRPVSVLRCIVVLPKILRVVATEVQKNLVHQVHDSIRSVGVVPAPGDHLQPHLAAPHERRYACTRRIDAPMLGQRLGRAILDEGLQGPSQRCPRGHIGQRIEKNERPRAGLVLELVGMARQPGKPKHDAP